MSNSSAGEKSIQIKKVIFIPDIHYPYHNKLALENTLNFIKIFKPNILVFLGDIADVYGMNSFHQTNDRLDTRTELLKVNIFFNTINKIAKYNNIKLKYALGNHENRFNIGLDIFNDVHTREIFGFTKEQLKDINDGPSSLKWARLMKLKENNWEVIPYGHFGTIDDLIYTHTILKGKSNNQVRLKQIVGMLDGASLVAGDNHLALWHTEDSLKGIIKTAMTFGWLGGVDAVRDYTGTLGAMSLHTGFGIGFKNHGCPWELHQVRMNRNSGAFTWLGHLYTIKTDKKV